MANRYDGSRSPVRALSTASRAAWTGSLQRPLMWSEPAAHPMAPQPVIPADARESPRLACPECGTHVRLALIPDRDAESPTAGLRTAPTPDPLPAFEDAVTGYKRDLVRRALEENDGVMTRAAKALGLKYTTFVAMVHRLEADGSDEEPSGDQR